MMNTGPGCLCHVLCEPAGKLIDCMATSIAGFAFTSTWKLSVMRFTISVWSFGSRNVARPSSVELEGMAAVTTSGTGDVGALVLDVMVLPDSLASPLLHAPATV